MKKKMQNIKLKTNQLSLKINKLILFVLFIFNFGYLFSQQLLIKIVDKENSKISNSVIFKKKVIDNTTVSFKNSYNSEYLINKNEITIDSYYLIKSNGYLDKKLNFNDFDFSINELIITIEKSDNQIEAIVIKKNIPISCALRITVP